MTTHLEEVVTEFDEVFGEFFVTTELNGYHLDIDLAMKAVIINAHITYLEGEIERLKLLAKDNVDEYVYVMEDEISHKQQELLQAKELLK
jgi:hypothetical protein